MENLSNEELFLLAQENEEAKNLLFQKNQKFSYKLAHKYSNSGIEFEDLVQISNLGLIKAFNTFKIEKGYNFITYAGHCMNSEILMAIRAKRKYKNIDAINLETILYVDENGGELTIMETISDDSDFTLDMVDIDYANFIFNKINESEKIMEIYKCHLKGERQANIAKKFGLKQSTISRNVSKVNNKLAILNKVYA